MVYNSNYSMEDYNLVMKLRKKGLGARKIKRELENTNRNYITIGTITRWIYQNVKPFQFKIIEQLKEGYGNISKEKAYIFGVLCGDGCVSTNNLISLKVTDLDFAEEFSRCMEKVYGLCTDIHLRDGQITNMTKGKKGKDTYNWEKRSKLAHQDLSKYSDFKTETWVIPKEILETSDLSLKSAFLRGLFDSEGTARLKNKGHAYLQICSGNDSSLLIVKNMLEKDFDIKTSINYSQGDVMVLSSENYKYIKNFADKINFTIKRKKISLANALATYKRKGLARYDIEFKKKVLDLLNQGHSAYKIGKTLKFPYTNIYDFVKQRKRGLF